MSSKQDSSGYGLPATFQEFIKRFPQLARTHESMAKAIDEQGPLDRKTAELVKIGICLGGGLESALRSHVRRAVEQGATTEEIEHVILMGMTTCGFPRTVAAWQWAQIQMSEPRAERSGKASG